MTSWAVGCLLLLTMASFGDVNAGRKRFRTGTLGLPPPPRSGVNSPDVTTAYYTQLQDHFEPTNNNTFQQKYFVSEDYFQKGGPVFIFISGEAPASEGWSEEGAWTDYAQTYNALMFQLEHRYYGDSHPTSDLSVDNMRYLSSEQALADVASFIVSMNAKYKLPSTTKWVAFGGSYAGNLAAWVRYKYPHLIHAAVSSSGPVLAKVDFFEYMNVVRTSLGTYSKSCPKNVEKANKLLLKKLKTTKGQKEINTLFNLCSPIDVNNKFDMYNFFETLSNSFAEVVQYDNEEGDLLTIDTVCSIMTDKTKGDVLSRLAAVYSTIYGQGCLDYSYANMVALYNQTSWDSEYSGGRQWTYQTCTEFGYYQTSEKKSELFGSDFPLQFFLQQCIDIFSPAFTKKEIYDAVTRTNTMYGGLNIKATRVVYVHGTIDPWHALGITKTRLQASPAIYIKGTAHCANMMPPSSSDPADLTAARKKIQKLIGQWLKEN